jgi:hypothetical protein
MLECPFCGERVAARVFDNWFECPGCQYWLRLRRKDDQTRTLDMGVSIRGEIQPVQIDPRQVRLRSGARRVQQAAAPRPSLPDVQEMDLQAVRTQRKQVTLRRRELETSIQRAIDLRAQSQQNDALLRQYTAELSELTREQDELNRHDQQLGERETFLRDQAAQAARQTTTSTALPIFGCSSVVVAGAIYLFTMMINLHLDPRAFVVLILIALGAGVVMLLISQMNRV